MKIIVSTLLFISTFFSYAQHDSLSVLDISYERILKDPHNPAGEHRSAYMLRFVPRLQKSLFFDLKLSPKNSSTEALEMDEDEDTGFIWNPRGTNLKTVYKDYDKDRIALKQLLPGLKFVVVEDSLSIFDWTIKEEKIKFLGIDCQVAEMEFRGREYVAYFSEKIPQGGPWKFDGLPGVILFIKSKDNFISFVATSIQVKQTITSDAFQQDPFEKDQKVGWEEFKALYKEKAIAASKFNIGGNATVIVPRIRIERYIEEDDTDYKADKNLKGNN